MEKGKQKKKERQYLMIDITNLNDVKSEINLSGLENQLEMINLLSQTIEQLSQKAIVLNSIIFTGIRESNDENSENTLLLLKNIVKVGENKKWIKNHKREKFLLHYLLLLY